MPSFMRGVVDALLPKGSIWQPAYGGDFDRLLDGVAENKQNTLDALESLAHIRDPLKCPVELLPDLEREFGVTANNALTETERRMAVAVIRYKRTTLPTAQKLQRALDMAGFGYGGYGLIVTPNASPPIDPSFIMGNIYSLTAHEFPSVYCAGNSEAFAGCAKDGYYLFATGDYYQLRAVFPQAGQICARAFDGSDEMSGRECAGFYETVIMKNMAKYKSPPEPYWSLIFFVGGTVTRNVNGSIANVAAVTIPATRRQELHRLILRIIPLGIWALMMVRYF